MAQKSASLLLRTPVFRMSYPNLVDPKPYQDPKTGKKGDPTYNVEALIKPDDIAKFQVLRDDTWEEVDVKQAMAEVAKTEWTDINLKEAVAQKALGWPLKDGEKKKAEREAKGKKGDVYEGVKVLPLKASKDYPPQLYVVEGGKFRELSRANEADKAKAEQLFVGGYYAKGNVNLKAVETPQGRYVTFYLNAIVFIREGERIGGMSAEERFGGIEGGESDYDPTRASTTRSRSRDRRRPGRR